MLIIELMCSWCHTMNATRMTENYKEIQVTFCKECGHRADVPRMECDCPRCSTKTLYNQVTNYWF